jgi:hypothetical protein
MDPSKFISIENRMLSPALFRPRGWDGHISNSSVGQLVAQAVNLRSSSSTIRWEALSSISLHSCQFEVLYRAKWMWLSDGQLTQLSIASRVVGAYLPPRNTHRRA